MVRACVGMAVVMNPSLLNPTSCPVMGSCARVRVAEAGAGIVACRGCGTAPGRHPADGARPVRVGCPRGAACRAVETPPRVIRFPPPTPAHVGAHALGWPGAVGHGGQRVYRSARGAQTLLMVPRARSVYHSGWMQGAAARQIHRWGFWYSGVRASAD